MEKWDPENATFKAKVADGMISVHAGGRWRKMYQYPYNRIPSIKIQKELIHRIWLNTGKVFNKDRAKLIF